MARLSSELVLSLIDKASGPARALQGTMGRLERSAVRMGTASRMALTGAAGAIAPIAGAYGASSVIREAADFESALTGIQKKAGITADQTAQLGKEIKDLATSGELAVPLEEIAAAYERGAAAGIPLDQLRQFALLSSKASDAFEMSATDVGNAAAGFNKALNVPMRDMESLFDLVNGLADSGIADESDIVEFLDRAGAMSKTFGLTVDQTAALGAALTNLKVPASQAATAMNSILTKLLAPNALSKKGFKAFERLTGDTEAFAKKVSQDADGALVDIVKRLKQLDKASRTEIIADLFGQEHLDVMSQLVEGSEELTRNLEYAANKAGWEGSLNKSYQLKLDDFWSQWTVARNTLRELMIDAGNVSMPLLKRSLEQARAIFDDIGNNIKSFETKFDIKEMEAAKQSIGELVTLIGELMGMGAGEGTAIEGFFNRLANLANIVSGAVNTTKDGLQHLGLAEQDNDTPEVRDSRLQKLSDDYAKFNPLYRWAREFNDYMFPPKPDQEPTGSSQPAPASQSGRVTSRPLPDISTDRFGGQKAPPMAGPIADPQPVAEAAVPVPTPRPADIPVPTPRPLSASDLLGRKPEPAAAPTQPVATPVPVPTQPIAQPTPPRPSASDLLGRKTAPAAPSMSDAEISRIDQQLGELVNKKMQLEQVFKLAPDPMAVTTMGQIADEMQRLIDRRNELSNMTVSPQVDASSIRAAHSEANSLLPHFGKFLPQQVLQAAPPPVRVLIIRAFTPTSHARADIDVESGLAGHCRRHRHDGRDAAIPHLDRGCGSRRRAKRHLLADVR